MLVIGAFFIACNLAWAGSCTTTRWDEQAVIKSVIDGDTVILQDGRHVRFIGLNAPETAKKDQPAQFYGEDAAHRMRQWLKAGDRVGLILGRQPEDNHRRTLAHLFTSDGRNLSQMLLQEGLAAAVTLPPNERFADCYWQAERQARHAGLGLWRRNPFWVQDIRLIEGGFHIIQAEVKSVGEGRSAWYLNFSDQFSVRIDKKNRHNFTDLQPENLRGRKVEVRGWIYKTKRGYQLNVQSQRHLQVL